jgi:hypothetical protein
MSPRIPADVRIVPGAAGIRGLTAGVDPVIMVICFPLDRQSGYPV